MFCPGFRSTPDPFLSPALLVADDVESPLEVYATVLLLCRSFLKAEYLIFFVRKEISTKLKGSILVKKIEMRSEEAIDLNGDCEF